MLCGSGIVYLVGLLLFRRATGMRWSVAVAAGAVAFAVLWPFAGLLQTAAVAWSVNAVLALVVLAEWLVLRSTRTSAG
jgi:biotin transporter BioY